MTYVLVKDGYTNETHVENGRDGWDSDIRLSLSEYFDQTVLSPGTITNSLFQTSEL